MKRTALYLIVGLVFSNVCHGQESRFKTSGSYDQQLRYMEMQDSWNKDKKLNGDPKVDTKKLPLPNNVNDPDNITEGGYGDIAYFQFEIISIEENTIVLKLAKEFYVVKNVDTKKLNVDDNVRLTGPVQYVGDVKIKVYGRDRNVRELRLGTMQEYKKWVVDSKKKKKPSK